MSRLAIAGIAALLAAGLGGCVVRGHASTGTAQPTGPTVVDAPVQPVPAEGTSAQPTGATVVDAPVAPVPAEGTASGSSPTLTIEPTPNVPPARGSQEPVTPPGDGRTLTVEPTPNVPPARGSQEPVTPPGDGRTLAVEPTPNVPPAQGQTLPVTPPPCNEAGNTSHCLPGNVCAIGTDQVLACRRICGSDADCAANERCVPTAGVNRNICLGR